MKWAASCFLLSRFFVRCTGADTAEPEPPDPSSPLPPPNEIAAKPHQRHAKALALPTTIVELVPESPPGASVVGTSPSLRFHTPYVTKGSRFEVGRLEGIAHSACFVSEMGELTPAYGEEPSTAGEPTQGHSFELRPLRPLQPNRWYRLVLELGPALRVRDTRASASDFQAKTPTEGGRSQVGTELRWSQHFFTGSSPRIVAARWIEAETWDKLELTLSEPVLVTRELCQNLVAHGRAAEDRECEAREGERASRLLLSLRPKPFGQGGLLELRLPLGGRSGARVGEPSSSLSRKPWFALSLTQQDFRNCSVNEHCWSEPLPKALLPSSARGCP